MAHYYSGQDINDAAEYFIAHPSLFLRKDTPTMAKLLLLEPHELSSMYNFGFSKIKF